MNNNTPLGKNYVHSDRSEQNFDSRTSINITSVTSETNFVESCTIQIEKTPEESKENIDFTKYKIIFAGKKTTEVKIGYEFSVSNSEQVSNSEYSKKSINFSPAVIACTSDIKYHTKIDDKIAGAMQRITKHRNENNGKIDLKTLQEIANHHGLQVCLFNKTNNSILYPDNKITYIANLNKLRQEEPSCASKTWSYLSSWIGSDGSLTGTAGAALKIAIPAAIGAIITWAIRGGLDSTGLFQESPKDNNIGM